MTTQKHRLLEIDALRGISAAAVVIYHYTHRFGELYGHSFQVPDWLHYGGAGVSLFFMISGFVIYWTISNCKYPLDFVWSRFSRLYPTYWLAVLLTFAMVHWVGLPGREVNNLQFLANLSMLQGFLNIKHVDGVYWTLCLELSLYFWVLLIFTIGQLNRIEFWLMPWMLAAYAWEKYGMLENPSVFLQNLLMIQHIGTFAVGILFYKIHAGQAQWSTYVALLMALVLAQVRLTQTDALIIFGLALTLWLGISGRGRWLTVKPLVRLGAISYPLYLLHQNMGYMVMRAGYKAGLPAAVNIALALIMAIFLAELMHRFVETPSKDFLVKFYKGSAKCRHWAQTLSLGRALRH